VSEELETGPNQSVNERLRGIDDQLARLQTEFNEAFARLRESTTGGQMETPMPSPITAAEEQKLGESSSIPAPGADFSLVKGAIEEIRNQHTQSDVLAALLRNAARFADRVALFVVKGDQAIGWRLCHVHDRTKLDTLTGISLPLSGSTVVSHAARSAAAETTSATSTEDSALMEQLGGEPQQLAAVPLVVRNRVVAVLYADSAWPHRDAIQLDGLEVLTRMAGMAVELIAPTRAAQPQPSASVAAPAPAPPAEQAAPEPETAPRPEETQEAVVAEAQPAEPEYVPQVETQAVEEPAVRVWEPAAPIEEAAAPVEEPAAPIEETAAPVEEVAAPVEEAAAPVEEPAAPVEAEAVAKAETPAPAEPTPPPVEAPAKQPAFTPQYSAPLGKARRWGVSEADLPIDIGEDERRLHNDARRFARLLVSEIKLYNEQKVNEGRSQGNIYDRLREDIDRSRQMYDKRVAPPVAARHDYFHQELVNTLAEGDPSKLGNSYPGAAVGVS
jgi:hypothetical protein